MANGRAKFTIGGHTRTLDIPLGLAIEIEDATGVGVAEMLTQGARLRFGHALAIVGATLEWHGIDHDRDKLLAEVEEGGIEEVVVAAAAILVAFFDRPGKTKGAKGRAAKGKANGAEAPTQDILT